jgi:NAD(P)-dependent dehydrogenase (short-subunit alcohol dehydrogenase family)
MAVQTEFDSLVAVVTGGGSGIGLASAAELASRGARVAILDRNVDMVPNNQFCVLTDVSSKQSVDAGIEQVVRELGRLDILVNIAGRAARGCVENTTDAEWHEVLNVNVVGMARTIRAALPHLRLSSHAAIVNMSSVSATVGLENMSVYSASKGAVAAMTRSLAAELMSSKVRVNCVSPATVATPWMSRYIESVADPAAAAAGAAARQPIGRMLSAEEVAYAVAFLASPRSSATTGIELHVDGGLHDVRSGAGVAQDATAALSPAKE